MADSQYECDGCRWNQPNQLAHMEPGGCLYKDYFDYYEPLPLPQPTHLFFDDEGNTITRDEFLVRNSRPWEVEIPWAPGVTIRSVDEFFAILHFMEAHNDSVSLYEDTLTLGLAEVKINELLEHPLIRNQEGIECLLNYYGCLTVGTREKP